MNKNNINSIISDWTDEFTISLQQNSSLCIALFSTDKTLLYANSSMDAMFKKGTHESFINPTFDKLLSLKNAGTLIFEGFLTLGDYTSVNTSIWARAFRKDERILILGGMDTSQLLAQNETMHQLNREINNLQRELIKEKHTLVTTLNQLNDANDELKQLSATKNKIFSIIAHDLRSPFNALLGYSELLMNNVRGYDSAKIENFAQNMNTVSKNAYDLLNNLLEWTSLQTGRLNAHMVKTDPVDIVNEIVQLCESVAISKGIQLQSALHHRGCVSADKQMLKTVLRNLIMNSLKFTHAGGSVIIETHTAKSFIQFSVTDTGTGIEPEFIDTLFMIDNNLSMDGTEGEKGTGLGLIICKEFVEKHGGKIWVESQIGKGSSFRFTIPLCNA
jgi:two-component system, sensor histidine kinase and response regulator